MQRPHRPNGERTRERILEAALPLFAEYGFAGTSTRLVAQAAGVNVATLAYYFEDKGGLYLAVLQRLHEDLMAGFPTDLPQRDPAGLVDWLAEAIWRFVGAHRLHIRLALRHVLDQGQHADVVSERWIDPLMARADALVSAFRPAWPSVERRLLVLTVMHAVVRFAIEDRRQLQQMLGDPAADVDEVLPRWISALLRRELGL